MADDDTARRETIGLDSGAAETKAFWREFSARWSRVLVGSSWPDAQPVLKAALAQIFGAPCQRCSVHVL